MMLAIARARQRGDRIVFLLHLLTAGYGTNRRFTAVQQYGRYTTVERTSPKGWRGFSLLGPSRDNGRMPLSFKKPSYIILGNVLK
jgi:hypothetical protein